MPRILRCPAQKCFNVQVSLLAEKDFDESKPALFAVRSSFHAESPLGLRVFLLPRPKIHMRQIISGSEFAQFQLPSIKRVAFRCFEICFEALAGTGQIPLFKPQHTFQKPEFGSGCEFLSPFPTNLQGLTDLSRTVKRLRQQMDGLGFERRSGRRQLQAAPQIADRRWQITTFKLRIREAIQREGIVRVFFELQLQELKIALPFSESQLLRQIAPVKNLNLRLGHDGLPRRLE